MSVVNDGAIRVQFGSDANTVPFSHAHNQKGLPGGHTRKFSRAVGDREPMMRVIPMQLNGGPGALFVGIAISAVFVEQKVGVFSRIELWR